MSAKKKKEAIDRLLRGESLRTLSRELGIERSLLEKLRERALKGTQHLFLDGNSLSTEQIAHAAENFEIHVDITREVADRIKASHQLLQQFVENKRVIYGVNTSMGGFVN